MITAAVGGHRRIWRSMLSRAQIGSLHGEWLWNSFFLRLEARLS